MGFLIFNIINYDFNYYLYNFYKNYDYFYDLYNKYDFYCYHYYCNYLSRYHHFLFRVRSKRTTEKPWYDVSDDEIDPIASIIEVRGSSDDDVF